jgi:hypothetical protein
LAQACSVLPLPSGERVGVRGEERARFGCSCEQFTVMGTRDDLIEEEACVAQRDRPEQSGTASPVVETQYGKVRGTTVRGVHIYKGIPYGGPTEGSGRFLPPARPATWTGIRDTTENGPPCVSSSMPNPSSCPRKSRAPGQPLPGRATRTIAAYPSGRRIRSRNGRRCSGTYPRARW